MTRRRSRAAAATTALVAWCCLAPPVHAQFAGGLGVRFAPTADASGVNGDRTGYVARLMYDRPLSSPRWTLRGEFAYNQMQYYRTDGADRFKVSENGFEVIVAARVAADELLDGLYFTAGPVAAFRAACGSSGFFSSNGRVACAEGETYLTGYALAAGYRWAGERRTWMVELRTLGRVTAAGGERLVGVSAGWTGAR